MFRIHLIISLITFVYIELFSISTKQKFKRLGLVDTETERQSMIERVFNTIKNIIFCLIPVVNILLLGIVIFQQDEIEKRMRSKINKTDEEE